MKDSSSQQATSVAALRGSIKTLLADIDHAQHGGHINRGRCPTWESHGREQNRTNECHNSTRPCHTTI